VVSTEFGRSTIAGRMSAMNCIVQSLTAMPPSTRRLATATPESAVIASTRSRVW
jgi:hypothetical protein